MDSQISAPVAKSAAVIPGPNSDSDDVHLSLFAHGHHYFPLPVKAGFVKQLYMEVELAWQLLAGTGLLLLRNHQAEQGEQEGFCAAEPALYNASVFMSFAQAGSNLSCRWRQHHQQQKRSGGKWDAHHSVVQSWVINCPTSYLQIKLRTDVTPG